MKPVWLIVLIGAVENPPPPPEGQEVEGKRNLLGLRIAPLDGPLVTDRPDFTESTDAVPTGHVQVESGYTYTYDREGKDRTREHTAPELLLRIGVAENFELRFGWDGYSWTDSSFETTTRAGRSIRQDDWDQGASDLSLGFKYKFFEQDGLRPHFGVIGAMTVPSGSPAYSSGDVDPEIVLLWAYDLGERFVLSGNVGVSTPTEEGDRFVQSFGSLSIGVAITDRLGGYFEYFGYYPNTEHSDCAHSLNGGFTYLLNDNFQVDWRAGFGLNEEADDFFTGVGFGWRF